MEGLTPMMRQYLQIKEEYKDCILFFRLGDFYEMFFEDAQKASRELEITLTSRDGGKNIKVPMCGVPYHAADGYIAKLIEKGYKVAICEQVEDPNTAKGIVKREVIRIITPGTVMDTNILDEKSNNYLAALVHDDEGFGLSFVDVSTGQFLVTEIRGGNARLRLYDEIARLRPAEFILTPELYEDKEIINSIQKLSKALINPYPGWAFKYEHAYKNLTEHFRTQSLDGYGLGEYTLGIRAAGGVLDFLRETQKAKLAHIYKINPYTTSEFMVLDAATRRNLELTRTIREGSRQGTLLWVLDYTVTAMGGRLLKNWLEQPLVDAERIKERLDSVEEMVNNLFLRSDLRKLFEEIYDLERLIGRVSYGTANAKDLVALKQSFQVLPQVIETLKTAKVNYLQKLLNNIDPLTELAQLLDKAIVENPPFSVREGGIIKTGYNEEVDRLRSASKDGKSWIAGLESRERERTGIKSLKVGYNKVFGYYIEITRANLSSVPDDYVRKQTLANAERYITPELKEYEALILGAEDKITQLEYELFTEVRDKVAHEIPRIQKTAGVIAELDVIISLAEAALRNNYTKPEISDSDSIIIKDGRHPVVEKVIEKGSFVPNNTVLDNNENRLIIITGPNMAGKSTYMRQVALIVLMAQIGSFVPAREAKIGIVDRIFTRVGASDDLSTGQSTFMVEMNEVANILNNATKESLIILDEIGRGTSTFDGLSIAWAVAEYIHEPNKIGAKTLFATHYHELTELAEILPGAQNYCVAVKEKGDDIIFLRKIIQGGVDRSYGIQVARLAGLPDNVIKRAKEISRTLETLEDVGKSKREASAAKFNPIKEEPVSQLSFFETELMSHPVIEEIKGLNLMNITPLDALNLLYELQRKIKESE